jgi:cytochrome c2
MNKDADEVQTALRAVKAQNFTVDDLDLRKQELDTKVATAEADLNQIIGKEDELAKRIKRMNDSVALLTTRFDQMTSPLVQGVVNAPIMEFAAGTIRVEQIVAENHRVDVNFAVVPRVDRCIMCHKAIDKKDPTSEELSWRKKKNIPSTVWSELPQPLKNHPRMDLFVGDNSPHPSTTYGCTVCHWGWDRETDFSRSGHTPDAEEKRQYYLDPKTSLWTMLAEDEDVPAGTGKPVEMTQRTAWQKNYHWEEQEFLLQPMRQDKFIQASCLKCHSEQTNLEGGEKLDHGRRLIEQLGCWACHKMKALESYTTHKVKLGEDFENICKSYNVDSDDVRRLNGLLPHPVVHVDQELNIPIRVLRKPGPSLYKVATKDSKDWVRKWLANPVAFRPNTYMPRFWGLSNNKDTPDRNNTEINAITEFLFAVSDKGAPSEPPVKGDVESGKKLINSVGCMACHVVDDNLMKLKATGAVTKFADDWQYRRFRSQGPQLAGTGSKTTVNWIYAWLKDPKAYHPKTKMPNLRLSDQEAADLAAYLATLHNDATDKETLTPVKEDQLYAETLEYLEVTLPDEEAVQKIKDLNDLVEMYFVDEDTMGYYLDAGRLARETAQQAALQKKADDEMDDAVVAQAAKMADQLKSVKEAMQAAKTTVAGLTETEKQNIFLGSKLIGRYGCFACHNIHGFETAKPIGTELSEWGAKPVDKLDFGLVELEPTREAWLGQKLHDPRSFDLGREGITRKPQELLKMGKFNVTDEQIEQITTVIMGMTDEKLMPNEPRQLSPDEFAAERGRWEIKELNCQGCHLIEGHGAAIRATDIPKGMEPPILSGTPTQLHQGQRTQPDWLFQFIKAPTTGKVRPWLKVRMPTFGLSDGEANILVKYFAVDGHTQFPYQTAKVVPSAEQLATGKQLFDQLKCSLCHIVNGRALGKPLAEIAEEDLPRLAPNLSLAHDRLQRDWIINKWLPDPLSQQPGTRMPQFSYGAGLPKPASQLCGGDGQKQIEALVDYVLSLGAPANAEAPKTAQAEAPKPEMSK